MSIAIRLRVFADQQDKDQQVLALEWWDATKATLSRPVKDSTVEQRLSQLLGDHDKGLRFFFNHERTRSAALFDVLGVPENERAELLDMAARKLRTGSDRPAVWVVDAHDWPEDRASCDARIIALETEVLPKMRPGPIALLVTDAQYRWLPRTLDDYGDDLRIVRVADEDAAVATLDELLADGAIAVGDWCGGPLERWVAMDWANGWVVHPVDSWADGNLRGVVAAGDGVTHPLEAVAKEAKEPSQRSLSQVELREHLVALADPERAAELGPAAERLWWAQEYGVPATSTGRERTEHALAEVMEGLGLVAVTATPEELAHVLGRAARRPVEGSLLRVKDRLHLVNPTKEPVASPLLTVHRVDCAVPALRRLREAVAAWTMDDADDDRFLAGVLDRLDPDDQDRPLFRHARATMLLGRELKPTTPARDGDWKAALTALLAGGPPAAGLRVSLSEVEGRPMTDVGRGSQLHEHNRVRGSRMPFLAATGERSDWHTARRPQVDDGWPVGTLALDRGATLYVVEPADHIAEGEARHGGDAVEVWSHWGRDHRNQMKEYRRSFDRSEQPLPEDMHRRYGIELAGYLPRTYVPASAAAVSEDRWLDSVEASLDFGASEEDAIAFADKAGKHCLPATPRYRPLRYTELSVPPSVWHRADRLLAMVWLALKEGLSRGTAAQLHDGTVLLPLRVGIVAELHVRRHGPEDGAVTASLVQSVRPRERYEDGDASWRFSPLTAPVSTWSGKSAGYHTQIGFELPRGLRLSGQGHRVDITFDVSPFFSDGPPDPVAFASVAGGGAQRRDDD